MNQDKFQFAGEALAFDFVNTEIIVRRKPFDLIDTPNEFLAWWSAAIAHYQLPFPASMFSVHESFTRAKTLRGALRRLFTAVIEQKELVASDLEVLNNILSQSHPRLVITANKLLGIDQISDETNAMLLTIAHSAIWLLTECDRERLHKCKNKYCVLMFLDTTKNGNRVWCSTGCLNRARSSENYRQNRVT